MNIEHLLEFYQSLLLHQPNEMTNSAFSTDEKNFWKPLLDIEILSEKGQQKEAIEAWYAAFQPETDFIADVVRMKVLVLASEFHKAQEIQVYWQKIMDKLDQTPENQLYTGFYYMYLGVLYFYLDEYEIAANYFGRADNAFKLIAFHFGEYLIQDNIALVYQELGAYGDARYHLREQLRRKYPVEPARIYRNYLTQGDLYIKTQQPDKAEKAYKEALTYISEVTPEDQLQVYHKLYVLLSVMNKIDEAEHYQAKGQEIYAQVFSDD